MRKEDESGAEMIEFAFVVILLIALVYGIVSVGITLAAKSTITQAAEDGARSGIVASTPSAASSAAQSQALGDLGWMLGSATCTSSTVSCTQSASATCVTTVKVCVNAYESATTPTNLIVAVTYNYTKYPLFPIMPGIGILAPSTITSSATLQVSTPTS
jgi:Flp pilus assembly protein TadG